MVAGAAGPGRLARGEPSLATLDCSLSLEVGSVTLPRFGKSTARVGLLAWGAASAALLAVAGCDDGSKLYSPRDAKRAFAEECFVLRPMVPEQPPDRRSRLLVPKSLPFTVVVARSEGDAKYAYRKLRRETTRFTFDLRERNVLTVSDTGLTPRDKTRLRRAMQHLRQGRTGPQNTRRRCIEP
jgi:hypothetical protein